MNRTRQFPELKIEKGYPIPNGKLATQGVLAMLRDTLSRMKPGDSFVWNFSNILTYVYRAAKQIRVVITTRKLDKGGIRVWRIK